MPISHPIIADGAVVVLGGKIQSVGRWQTIRREYPGAAVQDLGEAIILPGLINAHCHLEYTHLAGKFAPTRHFTAWLKEIIAAKSATTRAGFNAAWRQGAAQLIRTGTTTVADIISQATLPSSPTALRVFAFLEMTGIKSRQSPAHLVAANARKIKALHARSQLAGFSPHAPYSTTTSLLEHTARVARRQRWRVTTHVAESAEEFDMFAAHRGPMFDWLGPLRNETDWGNCSPVEHLHRAGLLRANFLAAHANHLTDHDLALLRRSGASVVHCPRSHEFFSHEKFPFAKLIAAGINVCLGTDSLATIRKQRGQLPTLDLFAEMRAFARRHPRVSPDTLLRLVTVNGAHALGLTGKIGALAPGAYADLIAIPGTVPSAAAAAVVLQHRGPILASLINGTWTIAPH